MTNVKHIREICKLAESFGLTVEKVEKGKHFKVYLDTPAGKKVLVISISASDLRAEQNNRSILKSGELTADQLPDNPFNLIALIAATMMLKKTEEEDIPANELH